MTHFTTDDLRWTFVASYKYPREVSNFSITTTGRYEEARDKAEKILDKTVQDADGDFGEFSDWFLDVNSVEEISE